MPTCSPRPNWRITDAARNGTRPKSRIFDIPIDLGRPTSCCAWSRAGSATASRRARDVRQRPRPQPVPGAARSCARRCRAPTSSTATATACALAAKALDVDVPHRMTGADWIWALAALCEEAGQSIYLLGSEPRYDPRGRRAPAALVPAAARSPARTTASSRSARRTPSASSRTSTSAGRTSCWSGMGTPKQEQWVERHADRIDTDVLWTVGALFDYVSGRVPRAPALAGRQRAGMDLPARRRASADVAPLSARQPGVPRTGDGAGAPRITPDPTA